MTIPDPVNAGLMYAVAAGSSKAVWAVTGSQGPAIGISHTEVDRWDGGKRSRASAPNAGRGGSFLTGVAATSATNAWAVGNDADYAFGDRFVIEHWNGATWTVSHDSTVDGDLYGVHATSTRDAWAVGTGDGFNQVLIEHWNGSHWAASPVPGL